MFFKILILMNLIGLGLSACATAQPVEVKTAQAGLSQAWQIDQHTVWEMEWPAAPVGGPLTVETWRAGRRYRFEILEAVPPALIGQVLIFDGRQAWRYNRFEPPPLLAPATPALSPVSDAFAMIDQLMTRPAQTATQEVAHLGRVSTQKITLTFGPDSQLILWRDLATNLPLRILSSSEGRQMILQARSAELLPEPPDELFEPHPF